MSIEKFNAAIKALANIANDPIAKLRSKRIEVAAQLTVMLAVNSSIHAKISKKSGIKPSQLSRQLSGETNLTLDSIWRICDAADMDFDLVFRKKTELPHKQYWEKQIDKSVSRDEVILFFTASQENSNRNRKLIKSTIIYDSMFSKNIATCSLIVKHNNGAANDTVEPIAA